MNEKIAFFPTRKEIVEIMINLTNYSDTRILETGFGDGAFLNQLVYLNQYKLLCDIYGIELDSKFYKNAQKKFSNSINLINADYLNYEFKEKFNLIIGNPPYITNDNLHISIKNKIKELTGSGEGNIYYAFIIQSIMNLKDNGELIYILPYDFFYNTYAKKLRDYMIDNGEFEIIIDLSEIKIFKNAMPETIIFKWKKKAFFKQKKIEVFKPLKISNYEDSIKALKDILKTRTNNDLFEYFEQEHFNKNEDIWSLSNFKQIDNNYKLSDKARVAVGTVNGCEKIFHITKEKKEKFNSFESNQYIKKFIKAKDLDNYSIKEDINEYLFLEQQDFKTEEDFGTTPNILSYLKEHKEVLNNRYITKSKKWWDWLAIRNLKLMKESFNKYKIIVPNITRKTENFFSITKENHLISGDVIMIIGNSEEETLLLFGILNSIYFTEYYKEKGAKKGKRTIFTQKILENIDIPKLNKKSEKEILLIVQEFIKSGNLDTIKIDEIIKG